METTATEIDLPSPPADLEYKASAAAEAVGTPVEIKPEGIIKAVVSVTGVIDEVKDIIEPGAYTDTLRKRRPKVIRNHVWNEQVGRVLDIEEYPPGDPRLPKETKDGRPWPKDAGALVATMQYNMATKRGRDAFEDVRFYHDSKEAEFSIGYQVPPGASTRGRDGVRRIKRLELFEISDVLFGAASLSMSLDVKNRMAGGGATGEPVDKTVGGGVEPVDQRVAQASGGVAQPEDDTYGAGELTSAQVTALHTAAAADPAFTEATQWDGDEDEDEDSGAAGTETKKAFSTAERDKLAKDKAAMKDGSFPVRNATDLDNAIHALGRAKDPGKARQHIIRRAKALGLTSKLPADWPGSTKSESKAAKAAGNRPISNEEDLAAAISELGKAEDQFKARRHIIRRAKALGLLDKLPANWPGSTKKKTEAKAQPGDPAIDPVSGTGFTDHPYFPAGDGRSCECGLPADDDLHTDEPGIKCAYRTAEVWCQTKAADTHPGDSGVEALRRWYLNPAKSKIPWGTPGDWAKCVRIASKHMTPEQAKGWCSNLHLLATGERPGVGAHGGKRGTKDIGEGAGQDQMLTEWNPGAGPGEDDSLEGRREALRAAVTDALAPTQPGEDQQIHLLGTWPDRVIAARVQAPVSGGDPEEDTFSIGYRITGDGAVELDPPVPVTVDISPAAGAASYLHATAATALDEAAFAAKVLLSGGGMESKAGRVLSGVNTVRLQQAVTALITVLAAAGVDIVPPSAQQVSDAQREQDTMAGRGGEPVITPDTTSAGAREAKAYLDPREVADGLAVLAAILRSAAGLDHRGDAAPFDERKALGPDWDEAEHPRDARGWFIEVGGKVRLSGIAGSGTGTVLGRTNDGRILIHRDAAGAQSPPEPIGPGYLVMIAKADGTPVGDKKPGVLPSASFKPLPVMTGFAPAPGQGSGRAQEILEGTAPPSVNRPIASLPGRTQFKPGEWGYIGNKPAPAPRHDPEVARGGPGAVTVDKVSGGDVVTLAGFAAVDYGARTIKVSRVEAVPGGRRIIHGVDLRTTETVQINMDPGWGVQVTDEESALMKDKPWEGGDRETVYGDEAELTAWRTLDRYREVEPDITAALTKAAESSGATMYGLKNRLKEQESLARKLEQKSAAKGYTVQEYAAKIGDALRYTMVTKGDNYGATAQSVIDDFRARGYDVQVENTWKPGATYKGINTNMTKDGLTFEVQFHTDESMAVKAANHKIYKAIRVPGQPPTPEQRAAADAEMVTNAAAMADPAGAGSVR